MIWPFSLFRKPKPLPIPVRTALQKESSMPDNRLVVTLPENMLQDALFFAEKKHWSLDELVSHALRGIMPASITVMRLDEDTHAKVAGLIEAKLEQAAARADAVADGNGLPQPPEPAPLPALAEKAPRVLPPALVQVRQEAKAAGLRQAPHSCVHHLKGHRQDGAGNATCNQEQQRGAPCHWPAGSAHECGVFQPIRAGHMVGQGSDVSILQRR